MAGAPADPPLFSAMQIRCPHCSHPVEVVDEQLLSDVTCPSCGSNISLVSDKTTVAYTPGPKRIGHFELLDRIGLGGFGAVWKAHDTVLDRIVALKVPRRGQLEAAEIDFFFRDARAAAQLRHPSIVSVHEVGRDGDAVFIASDFIEGANLHEWLSARPLAMREATELVAQIAEAVQHAHERGVVHRDLKPGNILMDQEGRPHVTDFGLAKRDTGEITMTLDGQILGTPAYMSPEQARGKAHEATATSDVYSLGVILFELLTGELPFRGEKRMLILQILNDEPPTPRKLNGRIPRDLETICLKAMAKEPVRRYAAALDLADDLRRFMAGQPIVARPIGPMERAWRWGKRNPVIAGLAAAVAALLLLITLVSLVSTQRLSSALSKTQVAERTARLREAEALIGKAHGTRLSHRPGQRFEALEALRTAARIGRELDQPAQWIDRLRNEAAATIALADLHVTHSWAGFPPGTYCVVPSHDFSWYARSTEQGDIAVYRSTDHSLVTQLPNIADQASLTFGPGKLLIVRGAATKQFWLWDLNGEEPKQKIHEHSVVAFDVRPDGSQVLVAYADHSTKLFAVATGSALRELSHGVFYGGELLLHPTEPYFIDHSYLAAPVAMLDMRSGAVVASVTPPWNGNGRGAWSPDGSDLVIPDGNGGRVAVFGVENLAAPQLRFMRELQPSTSTGGNTLKFNARGDRLTEYGWNGIIYLWDWATGRRLFTSVSMPQAGQMGITWDPSGDRLGFLRIGERHNFVGICSVAEGRECHHMPSSEHDGAQQAIHPGGELLAFGSSLPGVTVRDLNTGDEVAHEYIPGGVVNVQFDKNGNMYTSGKSGILRWPAQCDPTTPRHITFGPPQMLPLPGGPSAFAVSEDGTLVVKAAYLGYGEADFAGGWIWSREKSEYQVTTDAQLTTRLLTRTELAANDALLHVAAGDSLSSPTISPDGRFVAFFNKASNQKSRIQMYDSASGNLVHELEVTSNLQYVRFTKDGRFLATDVDGGQLLDVDSWKLVRRLGAGELCDVSADGATAAFQLAEHVFRLVDVATGNELVRLEDPEQNSSRAIFSPDSTSLAAWASDGFRVWDLWRIRAQLSQLGLDWSAEPYPDQTATAASAPPWEVEFVGVDALAVELMSNRVALANFYPRYGQWTKGRAILENLLNEHPDDHWVCFQLAVLQLYLNDETAYRRTARTMLERFEQGAQTASDLGADWRTPADIMDRTAKAGLLLPPEGPEEVTRLRDLAIRASDPMNVDNPLASWYAISSGLAEYRAGNYDAAEKQVRSLAHDGDPESERTLAAALIFAMAAHRLGRIDDAASWLATITHRLEEHQQRLASPDADWGTAWADLLICEILRREADNSLNVGQSPASGENATRE